MSCQKCRSTNIVQQTFKTGSTKHQCNECQWFWWVKPTSQQQPQQQEAAPQPAGNPKLLALIESIDLSLRILAKRN